MPLNFHLLKSFFAPRLHLHPQYLRVTDFQSPSPNEVQPIYIASEYPVFDDTTALPTTELFPIGVRVDFTVTTPIHVVIDAFFSGRVERAPSPPGGYWGGWVCCMVGQLPAIHVVIPMGGNVRDNQDEELEIQGSAVRRILLEPNDWSVELQFKATHPGPGQSLVMQAQTYPNRYGAGLTVMQSG